MDRRVVNWRCGMLDLLEAAALHAGPVDLHLADGWRRVVAQDVVTVAGEDWLVTAGGERIALGLIDAVRPAGDDR